VKKKKSRWNFRRKKTKKISLEEKRTILTEEQTVLSKERTVLSWMRTGLAFIGAGIIIVSILPELIFQIIGWFLTVFGFLEVFESYRRLRIYRKKMDSYKKKIGS
jgi:uncharacterized membrane protein YidH (DUF202 family)